MFSIGELSAESGVKIPTIRYYEQKSLMPEPFRSQGNQRQYSKSSLNQLVFIKHARELGFSLKAISNLIALSASQHKSCEEIDELAERHLGEVRSKLSLLKSLESELVRMISGCKKDQFDGCYVIESLANHDLCLKAH